MGTVCHGMGTVQENPTCRLPILNPNEEVLHVVLNGEDGWRRHANMIKKVRINGARKVIK